MHSLSHKRILFSIFLLHSSLYGDCRDLKDAVDQGTCYEEKGNTNLAQAAFERALIDDKNNAQAHLKLAKHYEQMGMKKQANAVLLKLNKTQLTPAQRTSLMTLKQAQEDLSDFKARASLDLGYDSNINISPLTDNLPTTLDPQTSTLFSRIRADGSYMNDLNARGGWYLRSDANLYYQNNASAHTYDVLYGRILLGGGYYGNGYSLYVPLFYNRLNYLDRDLLQESGIRPNFNLELSNNFILNLSASYSQRRYVHSQDTLRNDDIARAETALIWLEGTNMVYIRGRYENYKAIHDKPIAFTNKALYYAQIGGLYSFNTLFDLRANYQYRYGSFLPYESISRKDYNHDTTLRLEKEIFTHFRLSAQYRYVSNSSNFWLAEYTKNETMLGLIYNY